MIFQMVLLDHEEMQDRIVESLEDYWILRESLAEDPHLPSRIAHRSFVAIDWGGDLTARKNFEAVCGSGPVYLGAIIERYFRGASIGGVIR